LVFQADSLIGQELGGCRVERRLGGGAMGTVYLARHLALQKDVAIKVLAEKLSGAPEYVQRFISEARLAAQIDHPNIVQVLNVGNERGLHFIIMQYVEGETLGELLARSGKRTPAEAARIALGIAKGLAAAHEKGIIHRDIKPSNVLLLKDGNIKIADLGLARAVAQTDDSQLTQAGVPMGTPQYMPPEQAEDARSADERSDVYSLGCTLYHMLVGNPPFTARSSVGVITKHMTERAPAPAAVRPEIPLDLSDLTMRMMAKPREDRPQTMSEVVARLEAVCNGKVLKETTPRAATRKLFAAGAGAIAALFLIGIFTRPAPGQRMYEQTLAAWEANPTEYARVIDAFEKIAAQHPGTKYGSKAREEISRVQQARENSARSVFEQTRQIAAAATKSRDYAKALKAWEEFPSALLAGEIEAQVQQERLRARLPLRVDGFLKAMMNSNVDAAARFIDPEELAAKGREPVAGFLGFWRAIIGIGFEAEGYEIKSITHNSAQQTADVAITLKLFNKFAKKSESMDAPEVWRVVNNEWYLYPKPPEAKKK